MEGNEECQGKGGGAKSYCCTGTYTTTSQVLVPELADYEDDLSAWVKSPICGASTDTGLSKRAESKNPHYKRVHRLLAILIQGIISARDTKTMAYLKDLWDKYVKQEWSNLTYDNIAAWINDDDRNPEGHIYSPDELADDILCNADEYNRILDDNYSRSDDICVRSCDQISTKRNLNFSKLSKRIIELSPEDLGSSYTVTGQPTWGYIAETIMRGHMTLVYEQLIYTNNHEMILEIVYELPSDDPDSRETDDDRFAVWHFHFEHLALRHGVWRPGIYALNVFHGQNYNDRPVDYPRVRNEERFDGQPQARTRILQCETGDDITPNTFYWYPGEIPNSQADQLPDWAERLTLFGNYLWDQDLVTEATFTDPARGQLNYFEREESECPIRDLDFGDYTQSRQFTPDGRVLPINQRGG